MVTNLLFGDRCNPLDRVRSGRTVYIAALVRAEGLEPPRLSSPDPKSRPPTGSAAPAPAIADLRCGRAARLISWPNCAAHAKNRRGHGPSQPRFLLACRFSRHGPSASTWGRSDTIDLGAKRWCGARSRPTR